MTDATAITRIHVEADPVASRVAANGTSHSP